MQSQTCNKPFFTACFSCSMWVCTRPSLNWENRLEEPDLSCTSSLSAVCSYTWCEPCAFLPPLPSLQSMFGWSAVQPRGQPPVLLCVGGMPVAFHSLYRPPSPPRPLSPMFHVNKQAGSRPGDGGARGQSDGLEGHGQRALPTPDRQWKTVSHRPGKWPPKRPGRLQLARLLSLCNVQLGRDGRFMTKVNVFLSSCSLSLSLPLVSFFQTKVWFGQSRRCLKNDSTVFVLSSLSV